jgi:CubicO group peptidase (beta-lactamase class C family)
MKRQASGSLQPMVLLAAAATLFLALAGPAKAETDTGECARVSAPAWSRAGLAAARRHAQTIGSGPVLVLEDGRVVVKWGDVRRRLVSWSIRKSLISALFGIETERGTIDPAATLAELGIDDDTPLTSAEKQARIVDLLRARSGVYLPVAFETPRMRDTRPARGSHPPGSFFFYNNWDFNAVGTIYEQQTRTAVGEAFLRDIARPTGMQDFRASDVYWLRGPPSRHGAFHFSISTRDLARFGQLYLNRGAWRGRQIVPADWVARSTTSTGPVQFAGRDAGGYEYLWWVADQGVHLPGLKLDKAFSAQGAGGHYLLVIPDRRLVIAHRGANEPASHAIADATAAGLRPGISAAQFGDLVRLLLAARSSCRR